LEIKILAEILALLRICFVRASESLQRCAEIPNRFGVQVFLAGSFRLNRRVSLH
jgi:hypothetical protein